MEKSVLELNNKKLCAHCFTDISNMRACFKCEEFNDSRSLPLNTVVHGRYIIGAPIYYDNNYFAYYGYDPKSSTRVLVREFFPAGGFCKRVNKNIECNNNEPLLIKEHNVALNNFHTEVKLMSGIKEENTVLKILDLFDENGTSYCISEFPEKAMLLSDYLKKNGGKIPAKDTIRILEGVMSALVTVHSYGIIHGNVRPENIVLLENRVILAGGNFGGHAYLESRSSPMLTSLNKFAPLEQLSKSDKRGPWTDVYSLGATVYFMLTGKNVKNIYERIESLGDGNKSSAINVTPELPERIIPILEKMLEPKTQDRYASIYELCSDLRASGLSKLKLVRPKSASKTSGNKKLIIILISILSALLVAGAAAVAMFYFGVFDKIGDFFNNESGYVDSTGENESETLPIDPDSSEVESDPADNDENSSETDADSQTDPAESKDPSEDESNVPSEDESETSTGDSSISDFLNSMAWRQNIIRSSKEDDIENSVFGHSSVTKEEIVKIVFLDTLDNIPASAWDISEAEDGKVKAWLVTAGDMYELYIAAEGGVNAGTSCKDLFAGYKYLTNIVFNGNLHTDDVTDMSGMFKDCGYLKEVDLNGINTTNVINLSGMFEFCSALESVNLRSFNTRNVQDMSRMFYMCNNIELIDLNNFHTSSVKTLAEMFCGCSNLKDLGIGQFSVNNKTDITDMFTGCLSLFQLNTEDQILIEALEPMS